MSHYWCRIVGPAWVAKQMPTPNLIKVDARGYEAAARAHIACDGPRAVLFAGYADVEVCTMGRAHLNKTKKIRVYVDRFSKVVKDFEAPDEQLED